MMWTGLIWLMCGAVLVPVNTGYKVFEVPPPVVMNTSTFWDIAQFSPLRVNLSFGGICRLHHQGLRIMQAKNQQESKS
jgi:hypothetical protein